MREPKEILSLSMYGDDVYTAFLNWHPDWLMKRTIIAIEQAQIEAYNEGLQDAIENVEIVNIPGSGNMKRISEHSILNLKKK